MVDCSLTLFGRPGSVFALSWDFLVFEGIFNFEVEFGNLTSNSTNIDLERTRFALKNIKITKIPINKQFNQNHKNSKKTIKTNKLHTKTTQMIKKAKKH